MGQDSGRPAVDAGGTVRRPCHNTEDVAPPPHLAVPAKWHYTASHMATSRPTVGTDAADLLGGSRVLGTVRETPDLQQAIRAGLPYATLEALEERLGLAHCDLLAVLLVGWRRDPRPAKLRRHISPLESDRLYRVAHITQLTAQTLGSMETARAWLRRANRAPGGNTPLSMLDTEIGARQVEEVLAHIDFGMYA